MDTIPQIKERLESDFFTGPPSATKARLDECLASDSRNIRPGKRDPASVDGQAVTAIQNALRRVRSLSGLPEITDDPGDYGITTKRAVLAFKTNHKIVRPGQRLDDIVGRMTLTQLDDDLTKVEGKRERVQPATVVTQDVYIKIFGFDTPAQQGQDLSRSPGAKAFAKQLDDSPSYSVLHRPLETIWFVGGRTPNPSSTIVKRVGELISPDLAPLGRIFISGGSAGGKNVLEVAQGITDLGSKASITYMAIWDGAFQREDLIDPTTFDDDRNFNPESPATLKFKGSPVLCIKDNFFQSWGHTLDKRQEIHGAMDGFRNTDLTKHPNVVKVKEAFDKNFIKTGSDKQHALESAHIQAFSIGRDRSEARVKGILKNRPLA